jgi:hypothetical protein
MLILALSRGGAIALGALAILALIAIAGALKPIARNHDRISERGDYINEPSGFRKPPDEGGLL